MRLFIAINFCDEMKSSLARSITKLKGCSGRGNFTRTENLHLTLVFLGETNRVDAVKKAMDDVKMDAFLLCISGLGKFGRSGGDIYWVGAQKSDNLLFLNEQLTKNLISGGFDMENREYRPHITLAREVVLVKELDFEVEPMPMKVSGISLMKSERLEKRLVYKEIYYKSLI